MKKIILILLICIMVSACSKKDNNLNANNETMEVANNKNLSPLTKDKEFLKTIHLIRNEMNNSNAVVRADGTMILNSIRPNNEYLTIIKDERTKEAKYIVKTVTGDDKVVNTYGEGNETYTYSDLTEEIIFYDTEGHEIDKNLRTYNVTLAVNDKIFCTKRGDDYYDNLYVYDVKTKEITKPKKNRVYFYNDHIVLSSDQYDNNDKDKGKKEILICDDELNVIKRIEGYSIYSIDSYNNGEYTIAAVCSNFIKNNNKENSEMTYGEDYEYRYNYLDESFNLVFEKAVNSHSSISDSTTVTIHDGDIEYDYDVREKKKVSEDRPYSGFENYNDKVQMERKKYEPICNNIAMKPEYSYCDAQVYNGKALLFAHKADNYYDEENDIYIEYVDIYNDKEELLLEGAQFNGAFESEGYFLVDGKTVYDFDLNIVKQFENETYINRNDKGGEMQVLFTDSYDRYYREKPYFNVYDKNFNTLFENVVDVEFYTYDDYIVVATDDLTRIYDKNLNVVKEYNRSLAIHNWYDDTQYRTFKDLKTNREGIIDDKYNIIVDNLKSVSNLEEKCFTFMNGFKYGLMDYNQKVICEFSIFNTMTEDSNGKDYTIQYID